MKRLLSTFERKLAPHRRKLLHLVFLASLGGLVAGWSFLERFGPMSVILPVVLAIGTGLSEADHLYRPALNGTADSSGWKPERKKA
jgi:hypothetical protein